MNKKIYIFLIATLVAIGAFSLTTSLTLAEENRQPVVVGTVSAISGSTITVIGKQDLEDVTATTTFTVNAANAVIMKNGVAITVSDIVVGDTVVVKGTVNGANVVATTIRVGRSNNSESETDSNRMRPNVVGKVSAINGNTLTVTNATTTFTIDATNAKILRGNTAITISDIAIGDTVVVQGVITGTNVTATIIRDGKVGNGNEGDNNQPLSQIQGDGQPIVAGTISAINGSTLTVANANVTYAVDAVNAKILQGKNTILLSGVKVGDSVIVQGTVNGTSIVASTIIDQNKTADTTVKPKTNRGFFSSIKQWFKRLFGF